MEEHDLDYLEVFELALDTFKWVGLRILQVAQGTKDSKLSNLSTELFMLWDNLPSASSTNLGPKFQPIVELIEKHCAPVQAVKQPRFVGPDGSSRFPTLQCIADLQGSTKEKELELGVCNSLKRLKNNKLEQEAILDYIREFKQELHLRSSPSSKRDDRTNSFEGDISYPSRVNEDLHGFWQLQVACPCRSGHLRSARLRLEINDPKVDDGQVQFDFLFPCDPTPGRFHGNSAQCVQVHALVPTKRSIGKSVKIPTLSTERRPPKPTSTNNAPSLFQRNLNPGDFCSILHSQANKPLKFKIHAHASITLHDHLETPLRDIKSTRGTALGQWLSQMSKLKPREKATLIYTIAKSFWQYYNSGWMSTPWTHEDIIILTERGPGMFDCQPHPYIAAQLKKDQIRVPEFHDTPDLWHRYPSILALAMLLVQIITLRQPNTFGSQVSWDEAHINDCLQWTWETAAEENIGEIFHKTVKDVVDSCLSPMLFEEAPYDPTIPDDVERRKQIIYRKVVAPLKQLYFAYRDQLDMGQGEQPHDLLQPPVDVKPSSKFDLRHQSEPRSGATVLEDRKMWCPSFWLEEIDEINERLENIIPSSQGTSIVKIAVLDTGCDIKNPKHFIDYPADEDRVKQHWYDLVEEHPKPIDEDGHGTALTTLLLRVARHAKVYVIRVARSTKDLPNSQNNIAKAISYAANNCDVDIISMSFGFRSKVPSIDEAILKAVLAKRGRIAFFAAAANEGSNVKEMFPAHMESVVSVRGTDSMGGFINAYDPPPFNEDIRLFGTLGKDVPYDSLDKSLVRSGCSLATPILAGISAIIVQYTWCKSSESDVRTRICSSEGIYQVLKDIAVNKGNNRYYVAPFDFFRKDDKDCISSIRAALAKLPP